MFALKRDICIAIATAPAATAVTVDECTLPDGHPMKHKCHSSAVCVNTIGDYYCMCPRYYTHYYFSGGQLFERQYGI
jgi:Calcium-binding EGF domain